MFDDSTLIIIIYILVIKYVGVRPRIFVKYLQNIDSCKTNFLNKNLVS